MTKKVQWSWYTPCPVLWVFSGLWLVGWASRGSLAVTGSQVTNALLNRFSMFAVHWLITRGIVSQWGHGQRAWRNRNNRLLGLLYSPMRPFVSSRPRNAIDYDFLIKNSVSYTVLLQKYLFLGDKNFHLSTLHTCRVYNIHRHDPL